MDGWRKITALKCWNDMNNGGFHFSGGLLSFMERRNLPTKCCNYMRDFNLLVHLCCSCIIFHIRHCFPKPSVSLAHRIMLMGVFYEDSPFHWTTFFLCSPGGVDHQEKCIMKSVSKWVSLAKVEMAYNQPVREQLSWMVWFILATIHLISVQAIKLWLQLGDFDL